MSIDIKKTILSYQDDLRKHLRISLYANAYTLIASQFTSAVLGMAYWALASRFFSAEIMGQNSAIISTILLLSTLSELSLKAAMGRFVIRAGKHVRRLVFYAYGANIIVAILVTIVFFKLGSYFHFTNDLLTETNLLPLLVLLFPALWTIFYVQDGVLTGLRETKWVFYENSIYNVVKVLLLVGFFFTGNRYSIVASWFIPVPFMILLVNGLIFFRFIYQNLPTGNTTSSTPITVKEVATSVGGDHIGTILAEVCVRLLPLLVLNMLGKSASAYFYQAWLIGNTIYLITYNMMSSFSVEASSNPKQIAMYSRLILTQKARLIIPIALTVLLLAPFGLSIFGAEYARQGTVLLRWLALAAFPMILNIWYLGYARILGKVGGIIRNQGMFCVITLLLSYWLLPVYGVAGVGVAWFIAQLVVAFVVVLDTHSIIFTNPVIQNG